MRLTNQHVNNLSRSTFWSEKPYTPSQVTKPEDIVLYRIFAGSLIWDASEQWPEFWRMLSGDLATAIHGSRRPFHFVITGDGHEIRVYMGVDGGVGDTDLIEPVLTSTYPGTILKKLNPHESDNLCAEIANYRHQVVTVGTPSVKAGSEQAGVEQIERLIRGMRHSRWAFVVSAKPYAPLSAGERLLQILNELRIVQDFEKSTGTQKPLAKEYETRLEALKMKLVRGQGSGLWNACVTLSCNTAGELQIAKSLLSGVFGGEESYPDPIQVMEIDNSRKYLPPFSFIEDPYPAEKGNFSYDYLYASFVNSNELTAFARLPLEEYPGYEIRRSALFDVCPHGEFYEIDSIKIGAIIDRQANTGAIYSVLPNEMTRHSLIVGNTGSGKTNTIFAIIQQLGAKVPILVIEPAKTEYRDLRNWFPDLNVYSVGDDKGLPIKINPFEVEHYVPLQTQIDHLKALFNAAFMLWAPLPYVFERCIQEIYVDRGWDLITGKNRRGMHPSASPTFTDLYEKIDPVVTSLGYEERVTRNIRAALQTRINSLRSGAKGQMLDVRESISGQELLGSHTVFEIECLGDEEEKAFIVGLLLLKINHHYISQKRKIGKTEKDLKHITIIEEAHRLLANIPRESSPEMANARGKAVETFCNMLAEMRAYGEGFIIADQIPTKLAPELIKNTSLKIAHRLSALDDLQAMAASMNMEERQVRHIATLQAGFAAVFGVRDDRPILVKMPYVMGKLATDTTTEKAKSDLKATEAILHESHIQQWVIASWNIINIQRQLMSQIIAVLSDALQLEVFRDISKSMVAALVTKDLDKYWCELVSYGTRRIFDYLGAQFEQPFEVVEDISELALKVLPSNDSKPADETDLHNAFTSFCRLQHYPFTGCEIVCPDKVCFFRYLNHNSSIRTDTLTSIRNTGEELRDNIGWEKIAVICIKTAGENIAREVNREAKNRSSGCVAVQAFHSMPELSNQLREKLVKNVLLAIKHLK